LQGGGHAGEFELAQGAQGVCGHGIFLVGLVEVMGTADVFVVLWEACFQGKLFGQLVAVTVAGWGIRG
jgi:hypothetical protein